MENYLNNLCNRIKNFRNNKKGAFSILFVIVMLIVVIFIAGYLDIMRQTLVTTEVQGIMDLAGVAALREGLDEATMLEKPDELAYKESVIKASFAQLLKKELNTNSAGPIISYKINSMEVTELNDSTWGLGSTSIARDQLVLDSIVALVVPVSSNLFDTRGEDKYEFYDQLENTKFEIIARNTIGDGKQSIIIRSVTRIVR